MRPLSGSISFITIRPSVDLPEPDSPTTETVSPSWIARSMPSAATTVRGAENMPDFETKVLRNCSIFSSGSAFDVPSAVLRALRPGTAAISFCVYSCCGLRSTSSRVPCSTTRPWRITTTRSAMSATTPKSWVMNSTPMRRSACSFWIRSRIWRCVVTSSAVVGSSASSSRGLFSSAIAIITRWRWPPESWNG